MKNKIEDYMNWPKIEDILYSECNNPKEILGIQLVGKQYLIQTYQPQADTVAIQYEILSEKGKLVIKKMIEIDTGFYAILLPQTEGFQYKFIIEEGRATYQIEDPYRFSSIFLEKDYKQYQAGIHYTIYEKLGAHPIILNGVKGTNFAVWAPNAIRVSVVGDFNHWDGRRHQMQKQEESGIYELFVPGVTEGFLYKYEIKLNGDIIYLKSDPYSFFSEARPNTAALVTNVNHFIWDDKRYLQERKKRKWEKAPIHIYEVYLGAFHNEEKTKRYLNYRELAFKLVPYIKEMGYTHIELMPIMEHQLDQTLGYQVSNFYAPTSRYGTPEDFQYFINEMHKENIGVILDYVPAYFAKDMEGLETFDGTYLYESSQEKNRTHSTNNGCFFDYTKKQVSNFLLANAIYWIEKYHIDGIRINDIASMLYLNYGKKDGQWTPNLYGGNENLAAIEFLKHLNSILTQKYQDVLKFAEDTTAYPRITDSPEENGLGFDRTWNHGWSKDYLTYIQYDPYFRSHHHKELIFSMVYMYSERFILPFSHEEFYCKPSLLAKLPGTYLDKRNGLKLCLGYQMLHPGNKLTFMGQEIGTIQDFDENLTIDFSILKTEEHSELKEFTKELNHIYLNQKALYMYDFESIGFEWINQMLSEKCVITFMRRTKKKEDTLICIFNFSNVPLQDVLIGIPYQGKYKEIFNSDDIKFGGNNHVNNRIKFSYPREADGRDYSIKIQIGALSFAIFSCKEVQNS